MGFSAKSHGCPPTRQGAGCLQKAGFAETGWRAGGLAGWQGRLLLPGPARPARHTPYILRHARSSCRPLTTADEVGWWWLRARMPPTPQIWTWPCLPPPPLRDPPAFLFVLLAWRHRNPDSSYQARQVSRAPHGYIAAYNMPRCLAAGGSAQAYCTSSCMYALVSGSLATFFSGDVGSAWGGTSGYGPETCGCPTGERHPSHFVMYVHRQPVAIRFPNTLDMMSDVTAAVL